MLQNLAALTVFRPSPNNWLISNKIIQLNRQIFLFPQCLACTRTSSAGIPRHFGSIYSVFFSLQRQIAVFLVILHRWYYNFIFGKTCLWNKVRCKNHSLPGTARISLRRRSRLLIMNRCLIPDLLCVPVCQTTSSQEFNRAQPRPETSDLCVFHLCKYRRLWFQVAPGDWSFLLVSQLWK